MMVRDAPDAPSHESPFEVFMLRRTGSATFGAGMYVFPGGRVDDVDHAAEIGPFCTGLTDVEASASLGIEAGGLAYWVAAIRECFEEAGVLLAQTSDGGPLDVDNGERHAVHDGTLTMVELCQRHQLTLDLSTTYYVDHWITPLGERRRFDTRFFLTKAPVGQVGLHDDKETDASLWVQPAEALRMHEAGELAMMPPTTHNLKFLAASTSADEAMAAGRARHDVVAILPKLRSDPDGRIIGISLPGDPDYDAL